MGNKKKKWWVPESAKGKEIRVLGEPFNPYKHGIYADPGYPLNVLLPGAKELKKEKGEHGADQSKE